MKEERVISDLTKNMKVTASMPYSQLYSVHPIV